jgi:hypothetical protein
VFQVRPGKRELFEQAAKAYGVAAKRADSRVAYRVYEVIAGMPSPTFVIFSSVDDYAAFDQRLAAEGATWQGATEEEKALLLEFMTEGAIELEANRFRIDPQQSYVSQATKDKAPDFWNAK